eukprot:CAMPEP_0194419054 /NCGR_PEP_ID=MMETSP0176-20130528/18309_1 /TAXON_ID=216777 /ORGANISM="Proboscia alata, Strain PI-D3" /LENGTH=228 /DNA_ID=CAMNT_0039225897 /DNA_START=1 /DNA_END=687 /DNA_ORIENTATION=+
MMVRTTNPIFSDLTELQTFLVVEEEAEEIVRPPPPKPEIVEATEAKKAIPKSSFWDDNYPLIIINTILLILAIALIAAVVVTYQRMTRQKQEQKRLHDAAMLRARRGSGMDMGELTDEHLPNYDGPLDQMNLENNGSPQRPSLGNRQPSSQMNSFLNAECEIVDLERKEFQDQGGFDEYDTEPSSSNPPPTSTDPSHHEDDSDQYGRRGVRFEGGGGSGPSNDMAEMD